ncbi:hypothetical protein LUZ60_003684 [Juncus effusus]|nr:hypothetical protein LUZ60_003684 [Juncus effusus]
MANETDLKIDRINGANIRADSSSIDTAPFIRTPCYCEENVYFLCKRLVDIGAAGPAARDLFVVFISNEAKMIPLWYQKSSRDKSGLVVWDYHVICVQVKSKGNERDSNLVWDLDSSLQFPLPLNQYNSRAIRSLSSEDSKYQRLFRIVHAPIFLKYFASDRSHMKDKYNNWIALPPPYNPIIAEDGTTHNLNDYMTIFAPDVNNMKDLVDLVYENKYGVILSESMLEDFFSQIHV